MTQSNADGAYKALGFGSFVIQQMPEGLIFAVEVICALTKVAILRG